MKTKHFLILVGVGVAGAFYIKRQASAAVSETVDAVGTAINPVSHENIFNQGVNSIVQALTGEEHATLGGKIYDWTH